MAQFLRTITDYCICSLRLQHALAASHFKVKGVNEVKKGRDQWGIQGRAQGQAPPTLFLDQTEAKMAEKNFFETGPPPYLRV